MAITTWLLPHGVIMLHEIFTMGHHRRPNHPQGEYICHQAAPKCDDVSAYLVNTIPSQKILLDRGNPEHNGKLRFLY